MVAIPTFSSVIAKFYDKYYYQDIWQEFEKAYKEQMLSGKGIGANKKVTYYKLDKRGIKLEKLNYTFHGLKFVRLQTSYHLMLIIASKSVGLDWMLHECKYTDTQEFYKSKIGILRRIYKDWNFYQTLKDFNTNKNVGYERGIAKYSIVLYTDEIVILTYSYIHIVVSSEPKQNTKGYQIKYIIFLKRVPKSYITLELNAVGGCEREECWTYCPSCIFELAQSHMNLFLQILVKMGVVRNLGLVEGNNKLVVSAKLNSDSFSKGDLIRVSGSIKDENGRVPSNGTVIISILNNSGFTLSTGVCFTGKNGAFSYAFNADKTLTPGSYKIKIYAVSGDLSGTKTLSFKLLSAEKPNLKAYFTITPDKPVISSHEQIVFSASASGNIVEYKWYLDGKYVVGGAKKWQWKWLKPTVGEHTVKLVVKDKDGNTASSLKKFKVIQTGVSARSKYFGTVVDKYTIIPIQVIVNGSVDIVLADGKTQCKYHLEKGTTIINYRLDPKALGLSEEKLLKKGSLRIWIRALYPSGTEEYYLDFKLYRKPVLLIHGLWSSAATWKKMVTWLKGAGFKVYTLDYKKANAADPRYIARTYLVNMMKKIKNDYEKSEIAINSVDIVAHSMGGIVSRFYIQCINNKFKVLNVSRLITIGTPHLGSPEPQHYHDWIHGKGARKVVSPLINFIQRHESEGSLGKDGPALRELKPNSDTLKMINSRPLNVKLYAIVGINNWLGWYGVSCTKDGDSIVEIKSQKYRADEVYYVWEWHLSETGSYQVFEIIKDILKEKTVPSMYKSYTSVAYSIRVISVHSTSDKLALGFHKQWEVSGFKPEQGVKIKDGMEITEGILRNSTGKKLGSYNVISIGSKLGSNPKNGDNAYVVLEVRNLVKELIGKVAIRVKYPGGGLYAPRLLILSPSTFYVFPGSEIYISHKGPLNIVTDTSCIRSHDPEVVIRVFENKSVEIISLEGELDVWGSGKGSTTISKGQKVVVSTNGQLSKPTNIDTTKIERWWPAENGGIIDIILGIIQALISFIKSIVSQIVRIFFSK